MPLYGVSVYNRGTWPNINLDASWLCQNVLDGPCPNCDLHKIVSL